MASHETSSSQPHEEPSVSLGRLAGLTDAVIAFALTLLVLDLRPPEGVTGGVTAVLAWLWPKLVIYLVVFSSVANYWNIHQRSFGRLEHGDAPFVLLSLLSLLFITLVPAATVIVGQYPTEPLAISCYSVNWILLSLTTCAMWRHAGSKPALARGRPGPALLRVGANPQYLKRSSLVWLSIAGGFALALLSSFVNIYLAYALWLVSPMVATLWWYRSVRAHLLSPEA
jgi:uncharacterized membrane protein